MSMKTSVHCLLTNDVLVVVNRLAKERGITRTAMLEMLLREALRARKKKGARAE
jgi:hypothetical protein